MKKLLLSLLLVLACSLPVQAAEMVTIENASKNDVYNYILTSFMKNGYMIQESNQHNLIFRYDKTDMDFAITWGSDAYLQHALNFAQTGNDVLVSYEMTVINGSKTHPLTKEAIPYYFPQNKEYAELALCGTIANLIMFKSHFNGRYLYGFTHTTKKKKDYIEIILISPACPAEKAGLKVGDQIIKINDQLVKKISYYSCETLIMRSSLENKELDIQVRRGKDILDFKIMPLFITTKELEAL